MPGLASFAWELRRLFCAATAARRTAQETIKARSLIYAKKGLVAAMVARVTASAVMIPFSFSGIPLMFICRLSSCSPVPW